VLKTQLDRPIAVPPPSLPAKRTRARARAS